MAYVNCASDHTWIGRQGFQLCPQFPQAATTDAAYYCFDFTDVLADNEAVASASPVIETGSKAVTITETSVSPDGHRVSFKATGMATGDFTFRSSVVLGSGTTNTKSLDGMLRVV